MSFLGKNVAQLSSVSMIAIFGVSIKITMFKMGNNRDYLI